jgi:spore coat polysaccharide biosynthesis protein SpsF
MLATTRHREDDPLVEEAARSGALTFRGPDDNVLRRFVAAARSVHARFVVRATADNPAVDIDAAARVLEAITTTGADHAMDVGLPIGCAVEAITVRALRRALELTADPYDLEHVTPFIRRDNHRFHVVETPAPARVRRPDLRLTIDTPSDLQFMRQVLNRIGSSVPERPLALIIEVADHVSTGAVAS